jgi:hypothetical protein
MGIVYFAEFYYSEAYGVTSRFGFDGVLLFDLFIFISVIFYV